MTQHFLRIRDGVGGIGGHFWLTASRRAEVGVVARELADAQLQDARAVYDFCGVCGCGSDLLSKSRGGSLRRAKIGREGARANAVFLTACQTGLWLLDADSRIRDSVYDKARLNHSIYRGQESFDLSCTADCGYSELVTNGRTPMTMAQPCGGTYGCPPLSAPLAFSFRLRIRGAQPFRVIRNSACG